MATLLYRLGRSSYRRARLVIIGWLLAFAAVLGGAVALGGQTDETFTIPGTESQIALDQLDALFPAVSGASAQAVVVAPEGSAVTDAGIRDQIATLQDALTEVDGVDSVLGPFDEFADGQVSDDGSLAIVRVQLDGALSDISEETIAAPSSCTRTMASRSSSLTCPSANSSKGPSTVSTPSTSARASCSVAIWSRMLASVTAEPSGATTTAWALAPATCGKSAFS